MFFLFYLFIFLNTSLMLKKPEILLQFKITIFYFNIWSVMAKLNFQQSLLQSLVSIYPSEIILICWYGTQDFFIIIIIINFENSCAA